MRWWFVLLLPIQALVPGCGNVNQLPVSSSSIQPTNAEEGDSQLTWSPHVYHTIRRVDLNVPQSEDSADVEATSIHCGLKPPPDEPGIRIQFVVPDGATVAEGDLLIEFDASSSMDDIDEAIMKVADAAADQVKAKGDWDRAVQEKKTKLKVEERRVAFADLDLASFDDLRPKAMDRLAAEAETADRDVQLLNLASGEQEPDATELRRARDKLSEAEARLAIEELRTPLAKLELEIARDDAREALTLTMNETAARVAAGRAAYEAAKEICDLWQAQKEFFERQLTNSRVYAPRDGVITYHGKLSVGQLVFPDQQLFTLDAEVEMQQLTQVLAIPSTAAFQEFGRDWCLVMEASRVVCRRITTGSSSKQLIEIRDGLAEGERVLVFPHSYPYYITHPGEFSGHPKSGSPSTTIRCQLPGEHAITGLAADGKRIEEGDLLATFGSTSFEQSLRRLRIEHELARAEKEITGGAYDNSKLIKSQDVARGRRRIRLAELEYETLFGSEGKGGVEAIKAACAKAQVENANQELTVRLCEFAVQEDKLAETPTEARGDSTRIEDYPDYRVASLRRSNAAEHLSSATQHHVKLDHETRMKKVEQKLEIEDEKARLENTMTINEKRHKTFEAAKIAAEVKEARLLEKVQRLEDHISKSKITAPHDGIVYFAPDVRIGATAHCRQVLARLRPEPSESVSDAIVIPTTAILSSDQDPHCLVRTAMGIERRPITLGLRTDREIQVLDGLAPGEHVVRHPRQNHWFHSGVISSQTTQEVN